MKALRPIEEDIATYGEFRTGPDGAFHRPIV
jgi:hypothetical protein